MALSNDFRLVHMFELAALNFQLLTVVTPNEEVDKDGEVRIQIPKIQFIKSDQFF